MNCIQQQVPTTRSRVCHLQGATFFHTLVCTKAINEAYATWFRFPNWILSLKHTNKGFHFLCSNGVIISNHNGNNKSFFQLGSMVSDQEPTTNANLNQLFFKKKIIFPSVKDSFNLHTDQPMMRQLIAFQPTFRVSKPKLCKIKQSFVLLKHPLTRLNGGSYERYLVT